MILTTGELDELREKYEELLRLRLLHLEPNEPDPRPAMAALARRFPGSLRELDDLPLDRIEARLAELRVAAAAAAGRPSGQAPWMAATSLFHTLARGALAAKRWLAGRREVDEETRVAFARAAASLRYAADAARWVDDLGRVARPPRGRVTDLVFTRIADRLAIDETTARRLVFGEPRAHRRGER